MTSLVSFHLKDRVSLGFAEGVAGLALDGDKNETMQGEVLDKRLVKFVFSGGVIHSVSSEPVQA